MLSGWLAGFVGRLAKLEISICWVSWLALPDMLVMSS
jgi:hypothetical protein